MWPANSVNSTIVMNVPTQCFGLFIDINNTLYCACHGKHQVIPSSLDADVHSIKIVAGNSTHGSALNQLYYPMGIFVDLDFYLYIADYRNNRIQKFQLGNMIGWTVVERKVSETIILDGPTSVALDADNYLFIADMWKHRIIGSGPNGYRCVVGCKSRTNTPDGSINLPQNFAFDSYGNIFVSDRVYHRIVKFVLISNSLTTSTARSLTNETNGTATTNNQMNNGFNRVVHQITFYLNLCLIVAISEALF